MPSCYLCARMLLAGMPVWLLKNLMRKPVMLKNLKKYLAIIILSVFTILNSNALASSEAATFDAKEFALHHIADANEWHIVGNFTIPLPCILYHPQNGLSIFMSNKLPEAHHEVKAEEPHIEDTHTEDTLIHEGHKTILDHTNETHHADNYKGYVMNHGRVATADGSKFYDFSITKNVATLLLVAALLIGIFISVAKAYKRREGMAPKGLQSFMEPLILFVRDEVVKPNLGKKTDRYLPYMMTLFFFILFGNLLGLIPFISNPNLTGNITITAALALMTFLLINLHANKYYWGHIFNPPGVPGWVKIILVPIEIAGIFIKPVALMIRLFANITAGHIIILSLIGLIFIFGKAGANPGAGFGAAPISVAFALFMSFMELLVAFLQAYIFTMLSCLFIALAQEEHHEHAH
jgi:F-type H+-transporting ATPase subunit a